MTDSKRNMRYRPVLGIKVKVRWYVQESEQSHIRWEIDGDESVCVRAYVRVCL